MMNNGVVIIGKDKIFNRMIEIELKKTDCTVITASEYPPDQPGLVFIEIDQRAVTIELNTQKNDTDKKIFTRPLYVKDVVAYVVSALKSKEENSYNGENNAAVSDRDAFYDLKIDGGAKRIAFRDEALVLTKHEYELLVYLYNRRGITVSREEAISHVWKYDFTGDTNIVDVYIRYLRKKIDDKYNVKLIYTVRNKGYMIK